MNVFPSGTLASDPEPATRDAPSVLGAFAGNLAESAWLAALLCVPLFFNVHGERVFEEDKVPLLRSLALVGLLGLAVLLCERGRGARSRGGVPRRVPLVAPALLLTLAVLASTVFSVNPSLSFFGAYLRQQGTYTWLCYVAFFFCVLFLVRARAQVDRLLSVAVFASVPVSLYAVLQASGYDPLPWATTFEGRVYGPAGNPIFLGAYLAMVVPLTLARLDETTRASPRGRWPRSAKTVGVVAHVAALLLQATALFLSQSRGPMLGLAAGLLLFGVSYAAATSTRWRLAAAAVLVPAAVLAATAAVRPGAFGDARLGRLFDTQGGSARVRFLIWTSASDALLSGGWRSAVGYGPETFLNVATRYYPADLAYYEDRRALPDRAHDELLDAAVTIGLLGAAAELLFFVAFFHYAARRVGLVETAVERACFLAVVILPAAAGALVSFALDGTPRFAGIGVAGGVAGGVLTYVIVRSFVAGERRRRRDHGETVILLALLSAVFAHFVEIAVGIPIAATRLYFWTYAGLAVVVGSGWARERASEGAGEGGGGSMPAAAFVALALAVCTFDVLRPSLSSGARLALLLGLFAPTFLLGRWLLPAPAGSARPAAVRLALFAGAAAGAWLLFAVPYGWFIHRQPPAGGDPFAAAIAFARSMSHAVTFVYAAVFLWVPGVAALATWRGRPFAAPFARSPWAVPLHLALAAGTAFLISLNAAASRADILSKQAGFYERRHQRPLAARLFEEALALRPGTDSYAAALGRVLSEEGREAAGRDADAAQREFEGARQALERAREIRPGILDHTRNLARLHRTWGGLLADPEQRAAQYARADEWYERALDLAPGNAAVLNEWSLMQFVLHRPERALELLARSLAIDDRYKTTYWIRAKVRAATGDPEGALADYDRALAIDPGLLAALSGKGAVLVGLGRIDEAIEVNRRASRYERNDLISRKNLAVLYRQKGDLEQAIEAARSALAVAPDAEKDALNRFLAELESELAAEASAGADQDEAAR